MSTFRQKVQATTSWVKPTPEELEPAPSRKSRRARAWQPGTGTGTGTGRGSSASITAHRLFPAFAALWFAALFGFGSLAISGEALGSLVTMIGLPALVPAAAPPLGFTAHLLVALMMTVVGAAIGLALAMRLRTGRGGAAPAPAEPAPVQTAAPPAEEAPKVRARDAHPDAPPRRPLVLTEAFADAPEALDDLPPLAETDLLRRKPGRAASEVLASEHAPRHEPWIAEFTPGGAGAVQPLDLSALDLAEQLDPPAPLPFLDGVAELDLAEASIDAAEPLAAVEPMPEPSIADDVEPAPVAALPDRPVLIAATPQLPAGYPVPLSAGTEQPWSPVVGVPLEGLGLVQLIERLALAIAARKAAAEAQSADPAPLSEPEVDAPQAVLAPGPFSKPQELAPAAQTLPISDVPPIGSAREAILRRLGAIAASEADAAETASTFYRPARIAQPASAGLDEALMADTAPTPSAHFAAPAFARDAAAAAPPETDEALRAALATLQRMTARG